MLIERTPSLISAWPALNAEIWQARVEPDHEDTLPSLRDTGLEANAARRRAENMSIFFKALGARGRSPVEFQIAKASTGELEYSHRTTLVDFLLYVEVQTGLLIGFHDASTIGAGIELGLATDTRKAEYTHISQRNISLRSSEPVLIADGRIIGSLRHGPDHATRVTSATKVIWAVAFGSPDEAPDELLEVAAAIRDTGVRRGVWRIEDA